MATMTTDMIAERMKTIPDFILGKIIDILDSYEKDSTTAEGLAFEHCPKCGIVHPKVIKGGKTSTGKQMYRCMECQRRFTADYGTYSFYSHQRPEPERHDQDDLAGDLEAVSHALRINIATAFR